MAVVQPGTEVAGFRIDAIEREDVLIAHDGERRVALHVAREPPHALATIRFLERARRLRDIEHPHLLRVYGTEVLDGHAVAIAEAPPGKRLDRARLTVKALRQVAEAVDALEEAGAEPPPLSPTRIWIDPGGDAHLDGLDAHAARHRAASSSAALAALMPRQTALAFTRARDGAYLSAGQFAADLRALEARRRRWPIAK
jgi:hypothetical protein